MQIEPIEWKTDILETQQLHSEESAKGGESVTWREEDMYPCVRRNLRKRYPARRRWKIYDRDRWPTYEPDFVVERRSRGVIQRAVVEVKATCVVAQSDVDQLNLYVRNLAGGNTKIVNKMLVVPGGADTSVVPSDMEIMYLRKFKCENGDIVLYG